MFSINKLANCRTVKFVKYFHMGSTNNAKVAVVLSGCGVYDGSEIHESSACLVHLSRHAADVTMYAPDVSQMHVINHLKGEPDVNDSRNVLVESARIARGNIQPLSRLHAGEHDAVVFPGGFGAAKNLSTWAVENTSCTVNKEVAGVLESFHSANKPIGLTCIAPVLAAKCIPGVELTVGHTSDEGGKWPYAGTAGAMEQCGAKHVIKEVTEAHVDTKNKVVTTPAYMCNAPLHEIFDGIGEMVKELLKLTNK